MKSKKCIFTALNVNLRATGNIMSHENLLWLYNQMDVAAFKCGSVINHALQLIIESIQMYINCVLYSHCLMR